MRFVVVSSSLVGLLTACSFPAPPDVGELDARPLDAATPDGAPTDASLIATYPQPAAYWTFDDADVTGASMSAAIGGVDGVVNGTTTSSDAVVGESLLFDGSDDVVGFGDALDNVFAGADRRFSVSLWTKRVTVSSASQYLFAKMTLDTCDPSRVFEFDLSFGSSAGAPQFGVYTPNRANRRIVVGPGLPAGEWHHVVLTYDGAVDSAAVDRVRMYVDGDAASVVERVESNIGSFPFDIEDTAAHLSVGNAVAADGSVCADAPFGGYMDELAVWDSVLTPTNAEELYQRAHAGVSVWPP